MMSMIAAVLSILLLPSAARRSSEPGGGPLSTDSAAVATAVAAFHAALRAGDSAAVLAWLAPDATILEAGGSETVAEYRAGHLPGDIAFAQATTHEPGTVTVRVRGEVAWATTVSRVHGEFRGRAIDSDSAELMVLVREATGWRIAAIHWSSRRRAA
jgi:ketosteroid isomerase-like protein